MTPITSATPPLRKKALCKRQRVQQFTTDEAQTATLINTEGTFVCWGAHYKKIDKRVPTKFYPAIKISMCMKEALEPAARVFNTRIYGEKAKEPRCPNNYSHQTGEAYGQ